MRNDFLLSTAPRLFAVATVFNMGLLSFNKQSDATLEAISVMVQANKESEKPLVKTVHYPEKAMLIMGM